MRTLKLALGFAALCAFAARAVFVLLPGPPEPPRPSDLAPLLAGAFPPGARAFPVAEPRPHHEVALADGGAPLGRILSSEGVPGAMPGYGGRLDLLVAVDPADRVLALRVTRHAETPGYAAAALAPARLDLYRGAEGEEDYPDAVTGATVTCRALDATLAATVDAHRRAPRSHPAGPAARRAPLAEPRLLLLILLALAAALLRRFRHAALPLSLAALAVTGFMNGGGLSGTHLALAAALAFPDPAVEPAAWLLFALAFGALPFAGRFYCARLCPLSAPQDWLGRLGGGARPGAGGAGALQRFGAETGECLLLASLLLAALGFPFAAPEPLACLFFTDRRAGVLLFTASLAAGCLVLPRFHCRFFCLPGAAFRLATRAVLRLRGRASRGRGREAR